MTVEVDVLVVGGGPAGSVTSALLARRGLRVALIDRAVFPRQKPCGDYLNPGCDDVFERLGVRETVAASATPMRGMRLLTGDGDEVALPFPRRTGWSLRRARLDHMLLQHAARMGAAVRDVCRFTALERESRTLCAAVEYGAHTERYRARLVIAADGLRSAVARAAGIDSAVRRGRYTVGAYLEGLADRADAAATGAEHSSSADGGFVSRGPADDVRWGEIHLRREGYCGVAHFTDGLANVTLAVPRAVLRGWRGNIDGGYWAWLRECPGLRDRLGRARRVGPLTVVGPLGFHRRPVGLDRVMLVGDAVAHADPMTGQGVYLALRGAELCAEAAANALEGPGTPCLRTYAYARWSEFAPVFAASRLVQAFAFRRPFVRRAAEQLARHPDLRARLIGMVGNTHRPGAVLNPAVLPRLLGWV
jgi:flavin-dependent dehydrogenase